MKKRNGHTINLVSQAFKKFEKQIRQKLDSRVKNLAQMSLEKQHELRRLYNSHD